MNNTNERSRLHQKLLIWSYVLGSISALLGSLASVGLALEKNDLKYPDMPEPVLPPKPNNNFVSEPEASGKYFDL